MVTSFIRPLEWRPDRDGPPEHRGSSLHERLKAELGYPLGIAAGYELELHRPLRDGDRIDAVERIASVGDEETTRLGLGRRWVIENTCVLVGSGELVAVERFSMLGYDPAASPATYRWLGRAARPTVAHPSHPGSRLSQSEQWGTGRRSIGWRSWRSPRWRSPWGRRPTGCGSPPTSTATRPRPPAWRDQFVDTSTQLGLLVRGGRAGRRPRRPARPAGAADAPPDLPRRPPPHRGRRSSHGDVDDDRRARGRRSTVRALVGDAVHSTLTARVASAGAGRRRSDRPVAALGRRLATLT